MSRIIFKLPIALLLLTLLRTNTYADVILKFPENGTVQTNTVTNFVWENTDDTQEYVYKLEYAFNPEMTSRITQGLIYTTELLRGLPDQRVIYWRVKYSPVENFDPTYPNSSSIFLFGINKEIPVEIPKEEEEEESTIEPTISTVVEKVVKKTYTKEQKENIQKPIPQKVPPTQEVFAWNISSSEEEVLGTNHSDDIVCKFKYIEGKSTTEYCNIPDLRIKNSKRYSFADVYSIIVEGDIQTSFKIQVDEYLCKRSLWKPSTWFSCVEEFSRSKIISLDPNVRMTIYNDDVNIPIKSYTLVNDSFTLLAGHTKETEGLTLTYRYRIVNSEYKIYEEGKKQYLLKTSNLDEESKKPFTFPFEKYFGVTQWYGYTEYQKPHTGIDFGVTKENTMAVANGEIVSKGWNTYNGECNSGGNYIIVKQSNGMYTGYFHLDKIFVNTGDDVKQGSILARTGNTGFWNCQKLGYHLHFVTRKTRDSNSHVNPVKYIETDWNHIPTLGYKTYPGRLTGENPHPGS